MKLDKANQQKEQSKNRHRNQSPTYSHTQGSHKNTKLKAVICTQKMVQTLGGCLLFLYFILNTTNQDIQVAAWFCQSHQEKQCPVPALVEATLIVMKNIHGKMQSSVLDSSIAVWCFCFTNVLNVVQAEGIDDIQRRTGNRLLVMLLSSQFHNPEEMTSSQL